MEKNENRLNRIMEIIENEKFASVKRLSKLLNVSEVTIRSDLQILEYKASIIRTHGGATIEPSLSTEKSIFQRIKINRQLKNRIGKYVVKNFINNNEVVAMDASTSTFFVAKNLPLDVEFYAVTESTLIALELSKRPNVEIILLGGNYQKKLNSVGGSMTEEYLKKLNFDKAIVSAGALMPDYGLYDNYSPETYVKIEMAKRANEVLAVIDSTKIGKKLFFNFLQIDQIKKLITDSGAREEDIKIIQGKGVEVFIA